jgi:hypothetical protein
MNWITERLPTDADADRQGDVLIPGSEGERMIAFAAVFLVRPGEPWMPAPPAYAPPQTREERVQELLDAVDAFNEMDGTCEWTDVMNAREKLK